MKKTILSIFLASCLLLFTTGAYAWHIDELWYDVGVNGMFDTYEGGSGFHLNDSMGLSCEGGWHVDDVHEDPETGEIHVMYMDYGYDGWMESSYGTVNFRIVSDYGDPENPEGEPVPVDVRISGLAETFSMVDSWGLQGDFQAEGFVNVNANAWPEFGGDLLNASGGPWMDDYDYVNQIFELQSNTEYMLDTYIEAEARVQVNGYPPETFENWDAYNAYFEGMDYGEMNVDLRGELRLDLKIESVEAVPVPPALFLFGSGLLGLWMIKRKEQ